MWLKKYFIQNQYSLGVDFSEHGVFMLELCQKINELSVRRIADDGSPKDFKSKQVQGAISDLKVIKKMIYVGEELTQKDIKLDLQLNQEKHFPNITDDLTFDVLNESSETPKKGLRQIIVYAARTSDINKTISLAHQKGFLLSSLEPESMALIRLIFYQKKSVDYSKEYIALFFVHQEYRLLAFSREKVVREQKQSTSNKAWLLSDISIVENLSNDFLLENIQPHRCFIVCSENPSDAFIKRFSLLFKCDVEIINPFSSFCVEVPGSVDKSNMLIALGLALRCFSCLQ